MPKYTMHVISHTHWDREWYRTFQHFRMRLVDLIDELIKLMERDPEYKFFHMDGQTIVLDDYLQIRPENEVRLRKLVCEGRILIGPWYNQPDEFLVSGEAMIRNLMLGRAMGDDWGNWMRIGYVPDCFGHISQFPQIMRGFGIDNAVLFRGITTDQVDSEFTWRSPDASEVLCVKMPDNNAYSNFYYRLRTTLALANGLQESKANRLQSAGPSPAPQPEEASPRPSDGEGLGVRVDSEWLEKARQGVADLVADCERERPTTSRMLFMDGVDHILANPQVPAIIRDVNENSDLGTMIHSTLPDFIEAVKSENPDLQTVEGELRWSNRKWKLQSVLAGVMSSRIHLKQANHRIETLLEKWVEPFSAIAWLLGKKHPTSYIDLAWRYLLQNHPHDSICGCSLDQVHKDMVYRFDQARQIAEPVAARSLEYIAAKVETADCGPQTAAGSNAIALVVFNPLSWERSEVVDAEINLPNDWSLRGIRVVDENGDEVPFQVLDAHQGGLFDQEWYDIPTGTPTKYYRIAFLAEGVPSVGYKTFYVQALDTPWHPVGSLFNGPNSAENEHLILAIDSDGTMTVIDKETEEVYAGGMIFEDGGDFGDGWNYRKPLKDTVATSVGNRAQVSLVENGPARAAFKVDTVLTVPASMNPNGRERSPDTVDIPISSCVSLARGSRRVDIVTQIDNTARDHRLRVLFPSGVEAEDSNSESLFDVVTRPIHTMECPDWQEPMPSTHPQKSFVDVSGEGIGLTVINAGQPEFEVIDDVDRTIAVTLMRSVIGGVGGPENQEQGQLIGKHSFRYAIYPHKDGWQEAKSWQAAWGHNVPMRAVQTGIHTGELPAEKSFVSIDTPAVVMTALKKASRENAVVLRVFNITHSDTALSKISLSDLYRAVQTDLNEQMADGGSEWTGGAVSLGIGTRRIVTLKAEVR